MSTKEKAKAVVYAGVLILALTAQPSFCSVVDPEHPSGIAAWSDGYVLCTDGTVWQYDPTPESWQHLESYDVPVPLIEIREWNVSMFITHDGVIWGLWDNMHWQHAQIDIPCLPPVSADTESWGSLKAK
jgi:hypothetical protein